MIYHIRTIKNQDFYDITSIVKKAVTETGIKDGIVVVFVPHTTAGVTINENADPDVITDIISGLNQTYPVKGQYLHMEGNSHAHLKATLTGSSCTVIIENGSLMLGTWQGIYFCEFDGPRSRSIFVKIIKG